MKRKYSIIEGYLIMIHGPFGIPIYESMVEEPYFSKVQSEFDLAAEKLIASGSFRHNNKWRPNTHKLSDPLFESDLIDDENLVEFRNVLAYHIVEYTKRLGMPPHKCSAFKIENSWMTSTGHGEYAHIHNHHLSVDLSGVYYYKTTGDDGDIFFMNPCPMFTTFMLEHLNNNFVIKPKVGKLLLFPGWIEHGVLMNHTDHERMSVSFNINFRR